jgi:16S rRNA processing protein RimM
MVKFKGIDDERSAQRLLKKNIYLPDTVLPELGNTSFYDHEVVGYAVHDVSFGSIGILVEVLDHSANPLLQIDKDGIEVLVPIFDGLIVEVKRKEKILLIKAPEGLIELYLS